MEKTVESLAGYVEHIIYRNADNGYTVLNLVSGEDEITCVGIFSAIAEGENIEAQGEYTEHPTYGQQFKVTSFEEKAPEDEEAIERYLGSGAIKGIGLAMAARIVRRFKEDTFRIIEEEPERLAEIKGISNRKAMEIASQVNEKRDLRQAMIFLQQYGITMNLAVKVYQAYGQDVYGIIRENPYRLADDIDGVGFRTADEIAARVGIRMDSDFRVRSGILYTLLQASGEGHTYLPETELTPRASKLLNVTAEQVEKQYMDLAIERKIILKQITKDLLLMEDQFRELLDEDHIHITTDDGSYGEQGVVTAPLERLLQDKAVSQVFCVGPVPMMKFSTLTAQKYDTPITASLNPIMVDGTGMCGCCRVEVGGVTKFACVDGPDFDATLVDWDDLRARQAAYRSEEGASLKAYEEKSCACH